MLAFVAAGLVVSALHTAHEAGWLTVGQQSTVDLSAFVRPGSVQAALLTGMLGVQPHPVLIEVIGWLVYLVPVGLYVAVAAAAAGCRNGAASRVIAVLGGAFAVCSQRSSSPLLVPNRPASDPTTRSADGRQRPGRFDQSDRGAVIAATVVQSGPVSAAVPSIGAGQPRSRRPRQGPSSTGGLATDVYVVTLTTPDRRRARPTMTFAELAQRNGGRLPLGVRAGVGSRRSRRCRPQYSDVGTFLVDAARPDASSTCSGSRRRP